MRLRQFRGTDRERGVTLVEVLISIVVLGVITVPLGNAIIGFIRITDQTTQRMNESQDAQLSGAYFTQDVQSLGVRDWTTFPYPFQPSIALNVAGASTPYPCGSDIAIVRLAWDDPAAVAGPPAVLRAAYVVRTVDGQRQLHRVLCQGSATVVSDIVIARSLDPLIDPVATCPTTCNAATVPTEVSLTLTIRDPRDDGAPYVIVLNGQRRST